MQITVDRPELDLRDVQRAIIDSAYRYDEDLATSLAALIDDDPARNAMRAGAKSRLKLLEAKRVNRPEQGSSWATQQMKGEYPNLASMRLGALNADRIQACDPRDLFGFAIVASEMGTSRAYPIYSYIIENSVHKYYNSQMAPSILAQLFSATCIAAETSYKMALRSLQCTTRAVNTPSSGDNSSWVVAEDSRDAFIERIGNWFASIDASILKICDPYFGAEDLEA